VKKDEQDNHGACKEYETHVGFHLQFWADVVDITLYLINK